MQTYHITHNHSAENCFGAPNRDDEMSSLWEQIGINAEENNVDIKFFKICPSEHVFFLLVEADDYSNVVELGMLLYTDYFYAFEIAALILMVAMISAISLAFRGKRQGTKTQEISQQVKVKKADRIRIVKMDAEKMCLFSNWIG